MSAPFFLNDVESDRTSVSLSRCHHSLSSESSCPAATAVQHRYQSISKSKSRCDSFRISSSKKRRQLVVESGQAITKVAAIEKGRKGRDPACLHSNSIQSNPDPPVPQALVPAYRIETVNLPTNQTNRAQLTAHDGRTKTSNLSLCAASIIRPSSYPVESLNYCAALHSHHRRTVSGTSHRLASHIVLSVTQTTYYRPDNIGSAVEGTDARGRNITKKITDSNKDRVRYTTLLVNTNTHSIPSKQ